jgi:hypothetical protein
MNMRYTLLFISFLFLSFTNAQKPSGTGDGTIFGKIVDDKNSNPVEYVAIRLLKAKDSTIVTGVFSDTDGKFNLENLAYGNYILKLSLTGFTAGCYCSYHPHHRNLRITLAVVADASYINQLCFEPRPAGRQWASAGDSWASRHCCNRLGQAAKASCCSK